MPSQMWLTKMYNVVLKCFNHSFVLFLFLLHIGIHLLKATSWSGLSQSMPACEKCCVALKTSYLRVEPGKTCGSHSRFHHPQQLVIIAPPSAARFSLLYSIWQDSAEPNGTSLWPWAKETTSPALFSPFLFLSSPLFSPDSLYAGLCHVWFSLQCQTPPGQPESLQ